MSKEKAKTEEVVVAKECGNSVEDNGEQPVEQAPAPARWYNAYTWRRTHRILADCYCSPGDGWLNFYLNGQLVASISGVEYVMAE